MADKRKVSDPTVDDDNQSDSDEYEYEVVEEIEEVDVDTDELAHTECDVNTKSHSKHLIISEVETITSHGNNNNESFKRPQETHIVKTDGSTEQLKLNRTLTSQEQSILLPLIQGLIAAGEKSPTKESNLANTRSTETVARQTECIDETSSSNGTNILCELSTALNRLQSTLLEDKDVVTDTRKRNTILTLVAWLKRILQTSSNDNTIIDALSDLLPTELLLSRLIPQLTDAELNGEFGAIGETATLDRSYGSSKRFGRQKNKRFNTVGVSREELADARLYLQKKLLSENLASSGTSSSSGHASMEHQNILDDDTDFRRKSLNLQYDNDLSDTIDRLLEKSKESFCKPMDVIPPQQIIVATALPKLDAEPKVVLRRKANVNVPPTESSYQPQHANGPQRYMNSDRVNSNHNTDTDDDTPENLSHSSTGKVAGRPMNKFSLRKLKMKRANTIDIPKSEPFGDFNAHMGSDENANMENTYGNAVSGPRRSTQAQCNPSSDKDHIPSLQVKTTGDQKYLTFLNKQNNENRMSWLNPSRGSASPQATAANWSNKFGNIKNSFERGEPPVSPGLAKKNNFTHAPTSPFLPVHSISKPPQIPNGHPSSHHQTSLVAQKIAAIQSSEIIDARPQLKAHKSMPSEPVKPFSGSKWAHNFASVDSAFEHMPTSYNPLYVPLHQNNVEHAPIPSRSPTKTPVSPFPKQPDEFPAYTYTCTDYTRPTCVSTFGPKPNASSPIKAQILPDTSYIKNQSPQRSLPPPPSLASTKLSRNMRAVDYTSSSECLSESNSSYRSPYPIAPNRIYADNSYNDAKSVDEQEFMATSQIMKYPESQTATMITNKTKRYDQDDERVARNLHTFLTNNVHVHPQISDLPGKSANFSHVNKSYVPHTVAASKSVTPNNITTATNNINAQSKFNNFVSMENLSYQKQKIAQPHTSLKSAISTHGLSAQSITTGATTAVAKEKVAKVTSNQSEKPKQVIKMNSYGGQYMPPKVMDPAFDATSFRIKKQDHAIMNNLNRSNTISHRRPPLVEIKRKQSLPGQSTDIVSLIDDAHAQNGEEDDDSGNNQRHNYLPSGVLKRSKSGHTLALLQQFESRDRSSGVTVPPPPMPAQPLKSALKQTRTMPSETKPAEIFKPSTPTPSSANQLEAPKITETPSSPIIDQEHIIYPGQTADTTNKIKNYAQTLNAMHNRKTTIGTSVVSEETKSSKSSTVTSIGLQKSKSGTLLSIPKPFEGSINKEAVEEKQRTVAAYFSGLKSPQGLQRSSSQHSILSASSLKSLKAASNENIDINGNNTETRNCIDTTSAMTATTLTTATAASTTTTTKSAHHLKILKKQNQKNVSSALPLAKSQTMPHISSVNLLDESNVDDAFEDLFLSFNK